VKQRAIALLTASVLLSLVAVAGATVVPYAQDFDGLNQADTGALAADGWLVFANVFSSGGTYLYGYGPFTAPNDGAAFCAIAAGEGGAAQGSQQLSVYNDYNNAGAHTAGDLVEANVFQEQVIDGSNVGETYNFDFQAKLGNLAGATTAVAFIKTLNPAAGYATTNFITLNMTSASASWTDYSLSILIDPALAGQIIQIGFANTASNWEASGIIYDNINFAQAPVAVEQASWGGVKSLFR
jgi:hypothetical protein